MLKTANANDENATGFIVFYCRITNTFHPVLPSLIGSVSEKRNFEGVCSHCEYWNRDLNIDTYATNNISAEVNKE